MLIKNTFTITTFECTGKYSSAISGRSRGMAQPGLRANWVPILTPNRMEMKFGEILGKSWTHEKKLNQKKS